MIPSFVKSYEASAAITGRRIVVFSEPSTTSRIAMAAANTAPAIGVSDQFGAAVSEQCDVILAGLALLELGGTVTAGAPIMADAQGRGIVATAATASTRRIVGIAHAPGVVGDVIPVWVDLGLLDRP